ncbi:DExH-box splicing factor binding site-domain-containing protein [Butyriboletus roseoflavus]|nr:DExH-box splicing factor binding site-domain-containing protein [Butyriboletus roseoflavus]
MAPILVLGCMVTPRGHHRVQPADKATNSTHNPCPKQKVNNDDGDDMPPTPSTVSFTVRRPTPVSRPSSSGPESDGPFKVPALPRHLASAGSSATGSPLAGSPRTFSSRGDSDDDDDETGIVFVNGSGADDNSHHADRSDDEDLVGNSKQHSSQRCVIRNRSPCSIEVDSQKLSRMTLHSSVHQNKKKMFDSEAPLIIPTQPNPNWREAARRRRAACSRIQPYVSRATPSFVPDSALAATGADGSVGGLGTRDSINSGPQLSGLQINKRVKVEAEEDGAAMVETVSAVSVDHSTAKVVEETEDQRALRAILAGEDESAPAVDIIPVPPLSETDALKQDVQELPDVATAADYDRVPISAFGVAMLRGMGWSEGAVASELDKRRRNGLTKLYLPQARPALLGIGAKEREPVDDGSGKKKPKGQDMRYIPVARKESGRDDGRSNRSGTVSRYSSRSPLRKEREDRVVDREKSAYGDRERRKERDHDDDSRRMTKNYDERARERKDHRERDRDMERDPARGRSNPYRDRDKEGKGKQYDQWDRTRERDRRDRRDGR